MQDFLLIDRGQPTGLPTTPTAWAVATGDLQLLVPALPEHRPEVLRLLAVAQSALRRRPAPLASHVVRPALAAVEQVFALGDQAMVQLAGHADLAAAAGAEREPVGRSVGRPIKKPRAMGSRGDVSPSGLSSRTATPSWLRWVQPCKGDRNPMGPLTAFIARLQPTLSLFPGCSAAAPRCL